MPITAKLSRQFYERLGDEVANELVSWFNTVDEGYRQEFRDLFEAHFGRFEARLAQQTAELRSEFRTDLAALQSRLILWMFAFWVGSWAAIAATIVVLRRLL